MATATTTTLQYGPSITGLGGGRALVAGGVRGWALNAWQASRELARTESPVGDEGPAKLATLTESQDD